MFTIDTKIDSSKIMEKQLFKVLFSMNSHQVANPEMSLEDARSYVFFFRESGKVLVYVGLYFGDTDRRLFYTHSANPFPESDIADREDDARAFAEDLGAMLDEIDFSGLGSDEKKRWISEQEIFSGRKKEPESVQQPVQDAPPVSEPAAQSAPAAEMPVQTPPVQSVPPVQMSPVQPPTAPPVPAAAMPVQPPPVQFVPPMQMPPIQPPAAQPVPAAAMPVQTPPVQPAVTAGAPTHYGQQSSQGVPAQEQTRSRQAVKPQRKPGVPAEMQATASGAGMEVESKAGKGVDDLLEEAVKAGVVKAPKAQLKKEIRSATGTVSRDKEALARLLASF